MKSVLVISVTLNVILLCGVFTVVNNDGLSGSKLLNDVTQRQERYERLETERAARMAAREVSQ